MRCHYNAHSCFPSAGLDTGQLELEVRKEKLPYLSDVVFLLASTLIYPATFTMMALGELFIGIGFVNDKYKSLKANRKLKKIDNYTVGKIALLRDQRVNKLQKRLKNHKGNLQTRIEVDALIANYSTAKQQWIADDNLENWAKKQAHHSRLLAATKYRDIQDEIAAYATDDTAVLKTLFKARCENAKVRRQLGAKAKLHYLKIAMIMQLPVVGVLICAHSKKTTRDALQNEELIEKYNRLKKSHPFVKNF